MKKFEQIVWIMAGVTMCLMLAMCADYAWAHEGHGWTHLDGSSGPIIGQRSCGMGVQVWYIDKNSDNEVDRCVGVLFIHEVIHIRPYKMVIEDHPYQDRKRIGCSCVPVEIDG